MNRSQVRKPPKWWSPMLNSWYWKMWRPLRRHWQYHNHRLSRVDVSGLEPLERALAEGSGVLIAPNHSAHADPFVLYCVADRLNRPFYFMAAWHIFGEANFLKCLALRHHGCFSVDREGTDLRAFRQAVQILQKLEYPLVIFPEGEIYHLNDRITPFRDGPAMIALSAAKMAKRPVVCIPTAIKYHYIEDPTNKLCELMDELERQIFWRPRPDLALPERIYRFAEGMLALKELEYSGCTHSGPLPERIQRLTNFILQKLEEKYAATSDSMTIPERVKELRRQAIEKLQELAEQDPGRRRFEEDLDDLFLVVQLFSYPGDYVAEQPTIERLAETLDKFEEDVLDTPNAGIRGARCATVLFGEPIVVTPSRNKKQVASALTALLEEKVQAQLDEIAAPAATDSNHST